MSPQSVRPLFLLFALLHALGIASRFDALGETILPGSSPAMLILQVTLLFCAGFFEASVRYGDTVSSLPLWMRIRSKPIKLAFALVMTYLSIVVLQTWDVQMGPFNPSPPASWPAAQRLQWFGVMTFGALFPSYMLAAGTLIPALRVVAKLPQRLPFLLGLLLMALLGLGAGYALEFLVASRALAADIASGQRLVAQNIGVRLALIGAGLLLPVMLGLLLHRKAH